MKSNLDKPDSNVFSVDEMAVVLKITPNTVRYRLKKLDIKCCVWGRKRTEYYFRYDLEKLKYFNEKEDLVNNYEVPKIIHHTVTFWIIESKMNYLKDIDL